MARQRRFEAPTLAAVLAEVQKEIGPDAKITSAQKVRTGGVGGFFQKEKFEVVVDLDAAPSSPAQPKVPASLLDLAEAVSEQEDSERPAPVVEKAEIGPTPRPKTVSTESESFADMLSRMAFQADMGSEERPEVAEQKPVIADRPAVLDQLPVQRPAQQAPEVTPIRTRITDSPLAKLGLPVDYIPVGVDNAKMHASLVQVLQSLPRSPDVAPSKGSVVAVVGERQEAIDLATDICERWGQPPEHVVVASQSFRSKNDEPIIKTARDGADSKRSWSRRQRTTVVVVDAHPGSGDAVWANNMLTALEPIATYGIANATRKAEDVAAWADSLGGIDAIAVNHIDETVSPASILQTGIPVDRIDGRKASPELWAMLLVDRLSA